MHNVFLHHWSERHEGETGSKRARKRLRCLHTLTDPCETVFTHPFSHFCIRGVFCERDTFKRTPHRYPNHPNELTHPNPYPTQILTSTLKKHFLTLRQSFDFLGPSKRMSTLTLNSINVSAHTHAHTHPTGFFMTVPVVTMTI